MRIGPLLAAVLGLLCAGAASAEERINRFESDIVVQKDGSLDVTETIDVKAEGWLIRHGIFRDFPTVYQGPHGGKTHVGFTLLGTLLDGQEVANHSSGIDRGVQIKVGDPDRDVPPGPHRFTLHYRATHELGRFADFDELYWNATGNGWAFPIDESLVRVRLPSPASFGARAFYTGLLGSTEHAAAILTEKPGEMVVATTRPLGLHEGLTIAVSWPKGVIDPESRGERWARWFSEQGATLASLLGLWILALYYWIAWKRVGRDPDAETMVPLFSPPDDLSPAAVRYMIKQRTDARAMSAALINLGVRGRLRLIKEDGGLLSKDRTRIEGTGSKVPGPVEEDQLLTTLLGGASGEIVMKEEEHATFGRAMTGLDEQLSDAFDGRLFHRNWPWTLGGVGLFVMVVLITGAVTGLSSGIGLPSFTLGAAVPAAFIALRGALFVGSALTTRGLTVMFVGAVLAFLALISGAPLVGVALDNGNYWPFVPLLTALPLVISSFWWMPSPTIEGQRLIDKIRGFKHYLATAEGPQLDRLNPPEATPELFEKYLPYAIALDVENRWAKRFTAVLAAAAARPGGQQGFGWYSGTGQPWLNVGAFTSDLGSGLASTISSASTAPGSSSGSFGGGFSGGGGGGGGGGGW